VTISPKPDRLRGFYKARPMPMAKAAMRAETSKAARTLDPKATPRADLRAVERKPKDADSYVRINRAPTGINVSVYGHTRRRLT
jgi:hypothetical protein